MTALPAGIDPDVKAQLAADITAREKDRPRPQPVAGFDLTFSARKSISVLWALGDDATRHSVHAAHRQALADVLAYAERTAI